MKNIAKWIFFSVILVILGAFLRFGYHLLKVLLKTIWLSIKLSFKFLMWLLYFSSRIITRPFRLCFPPKNIDEMSGIDFENFSAKWLALGGYRRIKLTSKSSDYGVDILAIKDGVPIGVQCKRYSGKVGIAAVQEITAGLPYYNCDKGIVITNSTFTQNAIDLAASNGIELVDGEDLLNSRAAKTLIKSYFALYFNSFVMTVITVFAFIINVWFFINLKIFLPLSLLFFFICLLCLINSFCEIKRRKSQEQKLKEEKSELTDIDIDYDFDDDIETFEA